MPNIVEIPDVGEVEFPDEMSQPDISDAIQNRILKQPSAPAPELSQSEPATHPLIPSNIANAYGLAQMQTGMVNPSSERNQGESISPQEQAAIRATPQLAAGALMAPATVIGKTAYAGAADLQAYLNKKQRAEQDRLEASGFQTEKDPVVPGGNLKALYSGNGQELPAQQLINSSAEYAPALATAANVAKSLPEMVAMTIGNPTGVAGRLVALGFSADLISGWNDLTKQYAQEINKPEAEQDPAKLAQLKAGLVTTPVFTLLAGKHGLLGEKVPTVDANAAAREALNITPRDRTPTANTTALPAGVDLARYQNDPAYRAQISGTEIPNENQAGQTQAEPSVQTSPVSTGVVLRGNETPAAEIPKNDGGNSVPPSAAEVPVSVPPKAEEVSASKPSPNDFTPALMTGDQRVVGERGKTHQDIYDAMDAKEPLSGKMFQMESPIHGFVDSEGKFYTREEAAKALGLNGQLHSQELAKLQSEAATPSEPSKSAVASETLPPAAEPAPSAVAGSKVEIRVVQPSGEKPYGGGIITVKGTPVAIKGAEGHEFVAYKTEAGKWKVVEKTTGRTAGGQPSKTMAAAIASTEHALSGLKDGVLDEAVSKMEKLNPKPVEQSSQPPANLPPSASMGGALPSELERGQGLPTAMKYKLIDQERQQRGLEPLLKPEGKSDQAVMDKAMAEIDRNPKLPYELVKELKGKPRTIEAWERMVLLLHKIDLRNAYEKSAREAAQAFDDSKEFPDREADMVRANLETNRLSNELSDVEQASRVSGSETGRALRALQIMANEDYSLAALETSRRAAKGGAPLTDAERAGLTKVANDYKKANDELQKHIADKDKRLSDLAIKEALDKVEREAKEIKIHPKIIQIAEKIVAGLDKRADAARQRIKERGFRFNTGVDPTVLRDVAEIGAAHLGHKVLDFAKWSEKMISEFGEGIKPHLDEIFKASTKLIDDLKAEPAVKRELKRQDVTERIAATSENIQEKIKDGKKSEISGQVNRLSRWLVESGTVKGREALIDAVHSVLQKADPTITRREAMDAISGYGDFKQLTKDEVSVKLRGFRGEMQQIAKLEDMAAGKPPLKTGVERRTPTDEERNLIKAVNESKIKFQVPITDPATQLKSALDTRKTQVENQIKDLERRLREGDFSKKPRRELVVDRRLQELTAKRDAIRKKVRAAETEARNKNKSGFEKTFDWISNARRFAVLSGNKVLLKLAAYSATKLPTMFATEAVGGALGRLPYLRQVAERAPSEGGFSTRALTTAAAKFLTKGLEDAYKTAVEGHSDIKSAFSAKPELQRHWYDFAQTMHEVIKSPLRRAAFELSLAKRMEFAARKGTDITDPLVQMLLAKDAYLDSDRALLLESNRVASGIRGWIKQLEQKAKATGKPSMAGKAGATLARVELPILSVPLNYVRQTLMSAFGLISGSAKLARAFHEGIDKLTPEEADSIMRHFKYGSIGGAMLLYGFYDGYHNGANGSLGGFYQPREKRGKNQAQFGGARVAVQNVSGVFLHNPIIAVAQLGHTIGAITAQKLKKGSQEERGIAVGTLAGTLGLLNESPLGRTTELVSTLSDPHTSGQALNEHIKGIVIPQLMNEAAQFTDKPAQNLKDYITMDTRKREPHGLKQTLETGIPVLRESVPLKKP